MDIAIAGVAFAAAYDDASWLDGHGGRVRPLGRRGRSRRRGRCGRTMHVRHARHDHRGFARRTQDVGSLLDGIVDVHDAPVIALRFLPRATGRIAREQRRRFVHDPVTVREYACRLVDRLGGVRGVLDDFARTAHLARDELHRRHVGLDPGDRGLGLAHRFFLRALRTFHGGLRCLARPLRGLLRDLLHVDAARRRAALRSGAQSGEAHGERKHSGSERGDAAVVFHESSECRSRIHCRNLTASTVPSARTRSSLAMGSAARAGLTGRPSSASIVRGIGADTT